MVDAEKCLALKNRFAFLTRCSNIENIVVDDDDDDDDDD